MGNGISQEFVQCNELVEIYFQRHLVVQQFSVQHIDFDHFLPNNKQPGLMIFSISIYLYFYKEILFIILDP